MGLICLFFIAFVLCYERVMCSTDDSDNACLTFENAKKKRSIAF